MDQLIMNLIVAGAMMLAKVAESMFFALGCVALVKHLRKKKK
jgi:hypothetical protein